MACDTMLFCISIQSQAFFSLMMIPELSGDVYTVFLRKNNARMMQTMIPMM